MQGERGGWLDSVFGWGLVLELGAVVLIIAVVVWLIVRSK